MPTYIDTTNLSPATISTLQGPIITQIQITTSAYVVKDDTAVSTTGGYIKITGANFTAGTQVVIGTAAATSVTYVNATTLNVQVPAQSAGTYVVYVTTNTGSVAILVNGLTYSGDPVWVTGSTLTAGQVDTAISIQLSATGDAPVTYVLQAGSSLPPGVTLTSGGLLSGTVTGITSETVYNFTIEAIDGQAQESPRTFSITIAASDQYFEYVTSLLSAATPTSTFVTDASTNSFAVTVNGDTRPSNFGPYTPGYYSNFFGTAQFKLSTTGMTALGSDFTLEVWIYPTSFNDYNTIFDNRTSDGDANGLVLGLTSAAKVYFYTNAAFQITTSTSISLNTWTHIALVRSGAGSGNVKIYINGVADANTATYTTSFTRTAPSIGDDWSTRSNLQYYGYLSNLRATTSALYTSTFTPSTSPLTAISGTVLLTCQSNRFIDNSASNLAITRTGDVSVNGFDPFTPSSSYTGYGSGYFDGTGDYVLTQSTTAMNLGANPFCIEMWVYLNATGSTYYGICGSQTDYKGPSISRYNSNLMYGLSSNGSSWNVLSAEGSVGSITINPYTWYHVVLCRTGNTISAYVNGARDLTITSSATLVSRTEGFCIGNWFAGLYPWNGYISNARFVVGSNPYDATQTTITVPSTPLTAVANTQLLTLQNNQPNNNNMFLDSSTNNFNITRNGNTTQGTFSPYGGGWSAYFDGNGDYLSAASNSAFAPGTGDFTIECFVNLGSLTGSQGFFQNTNSVNSAITDKFWFGYGGGTGVILSAHNGGSGQASASWSPSIGVWYHVAVVRQSGTIKMFVNGVSLSVTGSTTFNGYSLGQAGVSVGLVTTPSYFTGYISNLRYVVGTAVYTTTFTPPTAPLTPIANTQLLTCADNRFIDDSPNNFTVTRSGDTSIQRFNPFNPVLTTPTSYSGFFDGTGDYLTTPASSNLDVGNVSWTIECWVYMNNTSGTQMILGYNNLSASDFWDLTVVSGVPTFKRRIASSEAAVSGGTISANVFTHVAVVRNGTAVTIYLNGSSVATNANLSMPTSMTDQILGIGANRYGSGFEYYFNGYISNIRIVKGTAVYTSNFTPSTTPLTAIANTQLLTLQSPTFTDNSTNNFTITAVGDTAPRQFNPFGWTSTTGSSAAYTPALYGGSGYFDGTGDYLSVPDNAVFTVGAGNFTLEAWVYVTATSGAQMIFGTCDSAGSQGSMSYILYAQNSSGFPAIGVGNGGTVYYATSSEALVKNQWNHIAGVRNGATVSIYVNGVQRGTLNMAALAITDSSQILSIGRNGNFNGEYLTGYISDARITNGTARYTSNFQPPVAPLTALQNTVLLNNMTGAGIYDSSMMSNYETVGNSSISTSVKKYGSSSMYFDGSGDWLRTPSSPNFAFGTGDFTLEMWAYFTSVASFPTLTDSRASAASTAGFNLGLSSARVQLYTTSQLAIGATTLSANTWYHIAVCRAGSTLRIFLNGAQDASISNSTNWSDQTFIVGATPDLTNTMTGYIDDLRITKGVARYTGTFTPPSSPYIRF